MIPSIQDHVLNWVAWLEEEQKKIIRKRRGNQWISCDLLLDINKHDRNPIWAPSDLFIGIFGNWGHESTSNPCKKPNFIPLRMQEQSEESINGGGQKAVHGTVPLFWHSLSLHLQTNWCILIRTRDDHILNETLSLLPSCWRTKYHIIQTFQVNMSLSVSTPILLTKIVSHIPSHSGQYEIDKNIFLL
jgi:hypothetical protein